MTPAPDSGLRPFAGRRILLGITGGIASYKSAWVARLLTQAGASVDVVMTKAALEFVGAITFEALTGRPVHSDIFAPGHGIDHIRLAKAADALVVAPATADFLARASHGHADDLLAAVLLATRAPVLLVPAMNDRMWDHGQTRANVAHLRTLGYHLLDPAEGPLAAGEGEGPGRMPEPDTIVAHVGRLLETRGPLRGRSVVVTGGPTREPIDPVRYLSNRSSGKMGVALAAAAWRRGADVELIAGPLGVSPPPGVRLTSVETTSEMGAAVERSVAGADVLIMAAAPADFRAAAPSSEKLKRDQTPRTLTTEPTVDILAASRRARKPGCVVVGFALETGDAVARARPKLDAKGLDLLVVNDALEDGAGFGVDTNRVTLLAPGAPEDPLPLMPKAAVADAILDRVEKLLREP